MAPQVLLAIGSDLPVRILAILGAFALGSFLVGWLVQIITRVLVLQKVPRWPLLGIRLLGGILCGWLVALWLLGGGGLGLGGTGGFGLGGGNEQGGTSQDDNRMPTTSTTDKAKNKQVKGNNSQSPEKVTLRIEILGDVPLKKTSKGGSFDSARRYRVIGEKDLRTLEEIKQLIRQTQTQDKSIERLEVILYLDSPERLRPQVTSLVEWASEVEIQGKKGLRVDFLEQDRYAPVE